nr:MAG TPA: Synapse associated protein 1 [Caudoviricetes sp.]
MSLIKHNAFWRRYIAQGMMRSQLKIELYLLSSLRCQIM